MKNLITLTLLAVVFTSCVSSVKMFRKGTAPTENYTEQVPFTRALTLIIVEVNIEGKPYRFLYDTGAPMVVSPELASANNMKVITSRYITDSNNNRRKQDYVKMPEFKLGNQPFAGFTAVVIDLNYSPVLACLKIDGIIGANMMSRAFWKIDYNNQQLHFSNKNNFTPNTDSTIILPFRVKATHTPVVDLTIDSVVIKNITFDTGSASALTLPKRRVPKTAKTQLMSSYGFHSSGVFGSVIDSSFYTQHPVNVGGTEISDMLFSINKEHGKSLLGTTFLQDYEVVLNWEDGKAFLTPAKETKMTNRWLGFGVMPQGDSLLISSVTVGSPAHEQGLKLGDYVISINNKPCEKLTGPEYCEIREQMKDKTKPVTLEIKDKGVFTFEWQTGFLVE